MYYLSDARVRRTLEDHLYALARYAGDDVRCHYLNAFLGVPPWIDHLAFDAVLFHYSFMAVKWDLASWERLLERCSRLRGLGDQRLAFVQDEYIHSDQVNRFLREFGVTTLLTLMQESEWEKVHPRGATGLRHYIAVAPGYIDEQLVDWVARQPDTTRTIDIGYRARRLPFWLGRHGQLKTELAEQVLRAAPRDLVVDVSVDQERVFYGAEWCRFLLRCRTALGCEGGASLHDPTGEVRQRVERYVRERPAATFDEVERTCFPGLDGNLRLFAISPRHFECAVTRTCQVLVEGEYMGILRAGVHYIELRKDWSNLPEVLDQIRDPALCAATAERAHEDIVRSGEYTYRALVDTLLQHLRATGGGAPAREPTSLDRVLLRSLDLTERLEPRARTIRSTWDGFRAEVLPDGRRVSWRGLAAYTAGAALRLLSPRTHEGTVS